MAHGDSGVPGYPVFRLRLLPLLVLYKVVAGIASLPAWHPMPWRVRYLANLIMVMNEDGRFSPREALVLSAVRNELRLTLHETAEAVIQAVGERQPLIHGSVITNERNLVDMLAGLLVDGLSRSDVVDLFIDQCAIPTHRLPALLDDARERHAHLHRQVTNRIAPQG